MLLISKAYAVFAAVRAIFNNLPRPVKDAVLKFLRAGYDLVAALYRARAYHPA